MTKSNGIDYVKAIAALCITSGITVGLILAPEATGIVFIAATYFVYTLIKD